MRIVNGSDRIQHLRLNSFSIVMGRWLLLFCKPETIMYLHIRAKLEEEQINSGEAFAMTPSIESNRF